MALDRCLRNEGEPQGSVYDERGLLVFWYWQTINWGVHYQLIVDVLEVISIFLSYKSKKREVVAFLNELHKLLESDEFDINTDLNLVR